MIKSEKPIKQDKQKKWRKINGKWYRVVGSSSRNKNIKFIRG